MNKTILVTGCSSGLGLALAKLYLQKGCKVIGLSRTKPKLEDKNFYFKQIDLKQTSNIKNELTTYIQKIASIDIVYLNAGMLGEVKTLEELSLDEIQEVYELNVYTNKELLDILKTIKVKTIIGISSGAAVNGSKGWGSYSLSKAGLNMLLNLYAKEMLDTKLFAIAPGVIETPMTDYIRYELDDELFTSAKRLKEGEIQTPKQAATRLDKTLEELDSFESGSFLDVRNI